jgi:cytochrome P450
MLDLTAPEFIANPYPAYQRLRADSPVCWDEAHGHWLVSRYADVHDLLRDDRLSSDQLGAYVGRLSAEEQAGVAPLRDLLTNRLLLTDNPAHRRIRSLMQLAFTPRRVEQMRPTILAAVNELVDRVRPAGRMDLVRDLADPLPSRIIAALLGLPPQDRDRFKIWTDDIYAFLGISAVPLASRARQATASARQLTAYLAELFGAIRRQPRDDLLSAMVAAEEQGDRLTETELFSNVVGLINASHETTTNLIANTALTLLRNPGQLRRLNTEPFLLPNAIEEGLRYESPIQIISRRAVADVTVEGVAIGSGDRVALLLGAANRDPVAFPDPDVFDVARPEIKHLAFGGGPHYCLGAALGRLEGQVAIETLFRRLPGLRLAEAPLNWRPYPIFRGLVGLSLEF